MSLLIVVRTALDGNTRSSFVPGNPTGDQLPVLLKKGETSPSQMRTAAWIWSANSASTTERMVFISSGKPHVAEIFHESCNESKSVLGELDRIDRIFSERSEDERSIITSETSAILLILLI